MVKSNINEMIKGWFIGNFNPTVHSTNDVEVALKKYKKGDYEEEHYHKIAREFTVIVEGIVEFNGIMYKKDDIIAIEPGEVTDFKAVTDVITVVVKIPGANNDKYIKGEEHND